MCRDYSERIGMRAITLHGLRHYFTTQCLESGIEKKVVQIWLGHSSYQKTIDIYSHIQNNFSELEAQKFDIFQRKH